MSFRRRLLSTIRNNIQIGIRYSYNVGYFEHNARFRVCDVNTVEMCSFITRKSAFRIQIT